MTSEMNGEELKLILEEGENQTTEFKENIEGLDREIVAFSNAWWKNTVVRICAIICNWAIGYNWVKMVKSVKSAKRCKKVYKGMKRYKKV